MFGLTFDKLIIIAVVAALIIGPTRLPSYASYLARMVKGLRGLIDTAKDRVKDEMGDDYDDVDWKRLDPRQYDPRRIIREALLDDFVPDPTPIVSVRRAEPPTETTAKTSTETDNGTTEKVA